MAASILCLLFIGSDEPECCLCLRKCLSAETFFGALRRVYHVAPMPAATFAMLEMPWCPSAPI